MYPITIMEPPEDDTVVNSGSLIAIPFTVEEGTELRCIVVHTAPTQDHSLRCWISEVAGNAQVDAQTHRSYWHPNRTNSEYIVIHDEEIVPSPAPDMPRPLPQGDYFVNILNLGNTPNRFSFLLTEN